MARVSFTNNLRRHLSCPPAEIPGDTVRAVLDGVFEANPRLRSYLLDNQGRLRKHVKVYIGGRVATDTGGLSDPVGPGDDVFVFQALSGG